MAFGYLRNQYGIRDARPLRRYLARTIEFLLAGRSRRVIETEMAGLSVLVPTTDRTIARSVYATGDWDPLLVGSAFGALRTFGHRWHDKVFLELGANFGVYSLPAVSAFGFSRSVAYEPDPASFALLEQNIERNGLRDRVTAYRAALSSEPAQLTLSLGAGNAGDNRIVTSGAGRGRATVRVPARRFDDEVAAGRIPLGELGLVWIDVQGHEESVLAGATSLLESQVPIVIEYSSAMIEPAARNRLDSIIAERFDILVDLGWSALVDRVRFQPAAAIRNLAGGRRGLETDLLLLHART